MQWHRKDYLATPTCKMRTHSNHMSYSKTPDNTQLHHPYITPFKELILQPYDTLKGRYSEGWIDQTNPNYPKSKTLRGLGCRVQRKRFFQPLRRFWIPVLGISLLSHLAQSLVKPWRECWACLGKRGLRKVKECSERNLHTLPENPPLILTGVRLLRDTAADMSSASGDPARNVSHQLLACQLWGCSLNSLKGVI